MRITLSCKELIKALKSLIKVHGVSHVKPRSYILKPILLKAVTFHKFDLHRLQGKRCKSNLISFFFPEFGSFYKTRYLGNYVRVS